MTTTQWINRKLHLYPDCPTCGQIRHRNPGRWAIVTAISLVLSLTAHSRFSVWAVFGICCVFTIFVGTFYEWLGRRR